MQMQWEKMLCTKLMRDPCIRKLMTKKKKNHGSNVLGSFSSKVSSHLHAIPERAAKEEEGRLHHPQVQEQQVACDRWERPQEHRGVHAPILPGCS